MKTRKGKKKKKSEYELQNNIGRKSLYSKFESDKKIYLN